MPVDVKRSGDSGARAAEPGVLCLDAADFRHRLEFLRAQATAIRRWTVALAGRTAAPQVGQALSAVDLLTTLYFHVLRANPTLPGWVERDRLLVSSSGIASALYATLGARGFLRAEELPTYLAQDGRLTDRPVAALPGIELSVESPGHALAVGIGLSLAARRFEAEWRTFVLLADLDRDDGFTWDAVLAASRLRMDNLIAVVNSSRAAGQVPDAGGVEQLVAKWEGFGWRVREVDGHDIGALSGAFEHFARLADQPGVIIAHTVAGKGVRFMEAGEAWRQTTPATVDVERALRELV